MLGCVACVRKPAILTSSRCLCSVLLQMLVSLLYTSIIMPFLSLSEGLLLPVHLQKSSSNHLSLLVLIFTVPLGTQVCEFRHLGMNSCGRVSLLK